MCGGRSTGGASPTAGGCGAWEAEQAEGDGWWWYPNGRRYHTPLRQHMKELVDEIIAEAVEEGWQSTRKRPGPKREPGWWLLNPALLEHMPQWAEKRQRCQLKGCTNKCFTFCSGCAKHARMAAPPAASTATARGMIGG